MRIPIAFVTLLAAVLLIATASAEDAASPKPEDAARKIKKLQQERVDVLKEMVETSTALFKNGRGSADEVCEAWMLLLKVEIAAVEKESDRITLFETAIEELNKCEQLAEERKRAARGTHLAVLKIKERRLEVEIELERAKAKIAQGSE